MYKRQPRRVRDLDYSSGDDDNDDRRPITKFSGTFLSNFYEATCEYDGDEYRSVEHAYQAAKRPRSHRGEFRRSSLSAAEAKKLGRQASLLPDWKDRKIRVMAECVRSKFNRSSRTRMSILPRWFSPRPRQYRWASPFPQHTPQN